MVSTIQKLQALDFFFENCSSYFHVGWKLVNFHMQCCHHFFARSKKRLHVSGVPQGRDYHTLPFYRLKVLAAKRGRSDLVTPVTSQFRQTPFLPEHGTDCSTLISGSCFQRTNPLLLASAYSKNDLRPTKLKIRCKKTISGRNLGMIVRWKATKGLFEAILFRGTLTGKDVSKVKSWGKRWRNRPFWILTAPIHDLIACKCPTIPKPGQTSHRRRGENLRKFRRIIYMET